MLLEQSGKDRGIASKGVERKKTLKSGRRARTRGRAGVIGRYIAVVIVVFIALAPLYWTFITSIKNSVELFASPPTIFPHSFDLSNYVQVFSSPIFLPTLRNSAIIAIITTLISLLIGVLCAYALARLNFAGRSFVLSTVLSVNMFPFIAMVGPLFVLFTGSLYLYNTYAALIIPDLLLTLPLTIWFLNSFFREMPLDLEEAARIDGASRLRTLWEIIVPLAAPGVFSVAILSFISVWNDFLFGSSLTSDQSAQPVTVGILSFNSEHVIAYGQLAAASIVVTLPLVVLVLLLQRRIVAGLTAGAVKG